MTIENPSYFENVVNKIKPRKEIPNPINKRKNSIEEIINQIESRESSFEVKHSFIKGIDINKIFFSINEKYIKFTFESNTPFEELENNYFLFNLKSK